MTEPIQCQYKPWTVSPPGYSLADILEERQITQHDLAERMGMPSRLIREIISGKATIVDDTAQRLERVLGTPADYWLRREARYRENLATFRDEKRLERDAYWLQELPIGDMTTYGWIAPTSGDAATMRAALDFFAVPHVFAWRTECEQVAADFRASHTENESPGAIAAWLRQGEIEAEKLACAAFDANKLAETLDVLRTLTLEPDPARFVPLMQQACARCGVAVVFVPSPKGCAARGATRWIDSDKAVVQLSLGFESNDQLWFTIFHELGHIVLPLLRVDLSEANVATVAMIETSAVEARADEFARDRLIPPLEATRLPEVRHSADQVKALAQELGIAPGIVVGRLQHDGHIPQNSMNELKVFYARHQWNTSANAALS